MKQYKSGLVFDAKRNVISAESFFSGSANDPTLSSPEEILSSYKKKLSTREHDLDKADRISYHAAKMYTAIFYDVERLKKKVFWLSFRLQAKELFLSTAEGIKNLTGCILYKLNGDKK